MAMTSSNIPEPINGKKYFNQTIHAILCSDPKRDLLRMMNDSIDKNMNYGISCTNGICASLNGEDYINIIAEFIESKISLLIECCPMKQPSDSDYNQDTPYIYNRGIISQMYDIVVKYNAKIISFFSQYSICRFSIPTRSSFTQKIVNRNVSTIIITRTIGFGCLWALYVSKIHNLMKSFSIDESHKFVDRHNVDDFINIVDILKNLVRLYSDMKSSIFFGYVRKIISQNPDIIKAFAEKIHDVIGKYNMDNNNSNSTMKFNDALVNNKNKPSLNDVKYLMKFLTANVFRGYRGKGFCVIYFFENCKALLLSRIINYSCSMETEITVLKIMFRIVEYTNFKNMIYEMLNLIKSVVQAKNINKTIVSQRPSNTFYKPLIFDDIGELRTVSKTFVFPAEINEHLEVISSYYKNVLNIKSQIIWQPFIGNIIIETKLKFFSVSVSCLMIQGCIFLMFETPDTIVTHEDVKKKYPIGTDLLDNILLSFLLVSLINKKSNGYVINYDYSGPQIIDTITSFKSIFKIAPLVEPKSTNTVITTPSITVSDKTIQSIDEMIDNIN